VMLCETLNTEADLLHLMQNDDWLMTEKMEGDRGQLHYDMDGNVYLTNRSGEVVNCPPHIAEAMLLQQSGTSFDGEVISVDPDGRAQLYVGARADIQLFVAFDLVSHPNFRGGIVHHVQRRRMQELNSMLAGFQVPLLRSGPAIRVVRWEERYDRKLELLSEVRRREGEGWVLRNNSSTYQGKRSYDWMRFRDREKEMDVVVLDYKRGSGKFVNTVGGVKCGLYDKRGQIQSIGYVGSGWTDAQRDDFWQRWQRGENGFVITIKTFGLTFADQTIRASGVRIRTPGDKQPFECTFASEAGREFGSITPPPRFKRP
jgi:ATP-dependent DNA ligase